MKSLFAFAIAWVTVTATYADQVELRYKQVPGGTARYRVVCNVQGTVGSGGELNSIRQRAVFDWLLETTSVNEGRAAQRLQLEKLQMSGDFAGETSAMTIEGGTVTMEMGDERESTPLEESEFGDVPGVARALQLEVDALGAVQARGDFGSLMQLLNVGEPWLAAYAVVFPQRALGVGESWRQEASASRAGETELKVSGETACKLLRIETYQGRRVARIEFQRKFDYRVEREVGFASPFRRMTEQTTGSVIFDIEAGRTLVVDSKGQHVMVVVDPELGDEVTQKLTIESKAERR